MRPLFRLLRPILAIALLPLFLSARELSGYPEEYDQASLALIDGLDDETVLAVIDSEASAIHTLMDVFPATPPYTETEKKLIKTAKAAQESNELGVALKYQFLVSEYLASVQDPASVQEDEGSYRRGLELRLSKELQNLQALQQRVAASQNALDAYKSQDAAFAIDFRNRLAAIELPSDPS